MIPNIVLKEYEAFGNPNYKVIRALLYMVDKNMMTALERPFFSSQKCEVVYQDDYPMCAMVDGKECIFLNVKDNYWCQWVYQFAHEYCHHLINGSHSGDWSGLLWFEETICELSSLYNLRRMIGFCIKNGLHHYAPSVLVYLNNLLTKNKDSYCLSVGGGWYKLYKKSLQEEQYKRELYNAIAVLMYPLFIDNPHLWKLILNIGDIHSWASLDDLFKHLEANADGSYSESLASLKQIFD